MNDDDNKDHGEAVDSLMASMLVSSVQFEVLLELIIHVAKRTGLTHIDGLPLLDWFQKEKIAQLQAALFKIEDSSSVVAAYFQNSIDDSERRIRERGGEV